jgi:hypothetical protein
MNYSEHIQMLRSVAEKFSAQSIRSLMDNDAQRIEKMTVDFADIRVDFSKQRLNDEIIDALEHLPMNADLSKKGKQCLKANV